MTPLNNSNFPAVVVHTPDFVRQYLVVNLPTDQDVVMWQEYCTHISEWAQLQTKGRFDDDPPYDAFISYPQLRGVLGLWHVAVAHRGFILWEHSPLEVTVLEEADTVGMQDFIRAQMTVGASYLWVAAKPILASPLRGVRVPQEIADKALGVCTLKVVSDKVHINFLPMGASGN